MKKRFQPWERSQTELFPPSIKDFVPENHPANFIANLVETQLDVKEIENDYVEMRGAPPFPPKMMVALLLYAYSRGVYSSRKIAQACEERVDFMAVTGRAAPDFRTVSTFRQRHIEAIGHLFVQVLQLCRAAGLVKLGHVALDGTKIKANASKSANKTYKRLREEERQLKEHVRGWFRSADTADAEEDEEYGKEQRGDEMPDWAGDPKACLERITAAKQKLEAEAKEKKEKRDDDEDSGKKPKNHHVSSDEPDDKACHNFTDPDSKLMKTHGHFEQCYNVQTAVDAKKKVIVAYEVSRDGCDYDRLSPMVDELEKNIGGLPDELSADAGYCSEENLKLLEEKKVTAYVACNRSHRVDSVEKAKRIPRKGTRAYEMWLKLKRGGSRSRYRIRKYTVEPVFGILKWARNFRQFSLRSLRKVHGEFGLLACAYNILLLAHAQR